MLNKRIFSARFGSDSYSSSFNCVYFVNITITSIPFVIASIITIFATYNIKNYLFYFSIELIAVEILMFIFILFDSL